MTHDAVRRDRAKVERLVAHGELVAVHPREVEQVLHETVEAPALPGDRRGGRLGVDGAVRKPFRVPENGGERRLQLVTDREQERALGVARMLELSRHVVEGLGERHELCRALGRNRAWIDAGREAAARVGDAPNRPGDPPREQKRDRRRERHADRRREQQSFEVRAPRRGTDHARSQQHESTSCDRPRGVEPVLAVHRDRAVAAARRADSRGCIAGQVLRRPVERRDDRALVLAHEERPQRFQMAEREEGDALALGEKVRLLRDVLEDGAVDRSAREHGADDERDRRGDEHDGDDRREKLHAQAEPHARAAL